MDGTIIGQGSFSANYATNVNPTPGSVTQQVGDQKIIKVPSGTDWISVVDFTQSGLNGASSVFSGGAASTLAGTSYYWQRGMPSGSAIVSYKGNGLATSSTNTILAGGFTLYDPTVPGVYLGNPVITTATTNATQPVVSTASTAGLSVGSIVRLSNTAQTNLNGIDMVVSAITANTSFTLLNTANALATAPGVVGGAGFYRIVNSNVPLFYPYRRVITNISQATNAVVSTSSAHGYVAGQAIRFNIPLALPIVSPAVSSGMIQLNPTAYNNYLYATVVTVIDAYDFTINIDTTGFSPFVFPTAVPSQVPITPPEVFPIGENTSAALLSTQPQTPIDIFGNQIYMTNTGILSDSTVNTGFLGVILGSGGAGSTPTTNTSGPAGIVSFSTGNVQTGDLMFWRAGKSTYGGL
jgi:hypothetical protein